MHRQVVFASSRRLPLVVLAGAALLLLGCQNGGGRAPGPMESSGSSGTGSATDVILEPGARSGAETSGEGSESGAASGSGSPASAEEVSRGSGAGSGAETGAPEGSDGGSNGGSNGGSAN